MNENYIININQLVQEVEKIENILTDRDMYNTGLLPREHDIFNIIDENIFSKYHPMNINSGVFDKIIQTKIAMTIGIEEYNFYKNAIEEDRRYFMENNIMHSRRLFYTDLVKLNAYIELFHSISGRAKDLIRFMITDNIKEALDISTAVESLCIVGINKNLIEIENLHREAKELINNGICENFKDAFAILLDINIDNLMKEKIQNSIVPPKDRILELKQNNFDLYTSSNDNNGKKPLNLILVDIF